MRFVIRKHAEEHSIFSENAFDSQIGKIVPVNFRETDDGPVIAPIMGNARLVGITILEHGKVAELTLETLVTDELVAELISDKILRQGGSMSFSFKSQ